MAAVSAGASSGVASDNPFGKQQYFGFDDTVVAEEPLFIPSAERLSDGWPHRPCDLSAATAAAHWSSGYIRLAARTVTGTEPAVVTMAGSAVADYSGWFT
ncbi:hypothetical protein [Shewanella sp.]|uniref:hypothetical protein n=1 Tax=Shewanella sp. TaxID=50422 RepID=UPI00356679F5